MVVWGKVMFSQGSVFPQGEGGLHGGGLHDIFRQTPPQSDIQEDHPQIFRQTPLPDTVTQEYGQYVVGSHPTGMHARLTRYLLHFMMKSPDPQNLILVSIILQSL